MLIASLIAIYFLPIIIATARHHRAAGSILALNLLLGWTFLFWAAALVWSFSDNTEANAREDALEAARYNVWAQKMAAWEEGQRLQASQTASAPRLRGLFRR